MALKRTPAMHAAQPKERQTLEVAPTVGFTVDEFKKG
jgi:hypothetical protein